ncbi:hypothetical protein FHT08_003270 [Xanthomonas campestris]|uniref:hypothetical protein n=1 Tax=Xanthomonas sp. CFBP 8151 TaxID=3035310 RepID=UPI00141B56D5|nr:hypothetical protein [Xanthomonas sp. CFBP 8151]NIJ78150.1 hypothetical protein [Xanthomonas sp. CFBP 8151]
MRGQNKVWMSACLIPLMLAACGGETGPSKEDAVTAVERFFTDQGQQATLQRSWRLEVKDAAGLELDCEKMPNGDQQCRVTGAVEAQGVIGGQPTTPRPKEMRLDLRMRFRPDGEGWRVSEVTDEGTAAG